MVYIRHNVHLSENQLKKLNTASKAKRSVSIRIDPTIRSNYQLYLTSRQIEKLKKNRPVDITLSKTQLQKNGGFIFSVPAILAGIGAAASVATGAANIVKAVNEKKHQKKVESILRGKKGLGVYIPGKKNLIKV